MVTVPRLESRSARIILERLGSAYPAEYVGVEAWVGSLRNESLEDVGRRVEADGGQVIVGWALWKSELLVEAEYHAVWLDGEGRKVDIAQRELVLDHILFVPDDRTPYVGQAVNNLRANIGSSPVVDYLIQAYDCVFALENSGDRSREAKVVLSGMEAALHKYFSMLKGRLELYAYSGATISSPCFCGSRKPFHSCHQEDICKAIAKVRALAPQP